MSGEHELGERVADVIKRAKSMCEEELVGDGEWCVEDVASVRRSE